MQISPWIIGAALLVPFAGAFAGHSMSAQPIAIQTDIDASLPVPGTGYAKDAAVRTTDRLPDHYAMETPEGRVEVAELALRGRYRDRARWGMADPYSGDYDVDADIARMEARWSVEESTRNAAAALDAQQPQLARAEPGARYVDAPHYTAMSEARTGEATPDVIEISQPAAQTSPYGRTIDVQAALAQGN